MNTTQLKLAMIGMFTFIVALLFFSSCYNNRNEVKQEVTFESPQIDLPEEYTQISSNCNKPDTLSAYYLGDKLFFRFIPH